MVVNGIKFNYLNKPPFEDAIKYYKDLKAPSKKYKNGREKDVRHSVATYITGSSISAISAVRLYNPRHSRHN